MRNTAKCNLCKDVIESYTIQDYVTCKCGEIGIRGGTQFLHAEAKNWDNFFRLDEEGNEIKVKFKDHLIEDNSSEDNQNTKKTLQFTIDQMIETLENLPQHAMLTPVTQYDLYSVLLILSSFCKLND